MIIDLRIAHAPILSNIKKGRAHASYAGKIAIIICCKYPPPLIINKSTKKKKATTTKNLLDDP